VLELEPGNRQAAERLPALQAALEAKREQVKKEMMGALRSQCRGAKEELTRAGRHAEGIRERHPG